jgi:hypothetical protein
VYGILSVCLSCIPIAGVVFGVMAMKNANQELDRLPRTRRAQSARKTMTAATILGIVGICLSAVVFVLGLVLRFVELGN